MIAQKRESAEHCTCSIAIGGVAMAEVDIYKAGTTGGMKGDTNLDFRVPSLLKGYSNGCG